MYNQIKAAAEAAIKLQNKNEMEAALRRIVAMCDESSLLVRKEQFSQPFPGALTDGPDGAASVAAAQPVSVKISTHVPGATYEKYDDSKSVRVQINDLPSEVSVSTDCTQRAAVTVPLAAQEASGAKPAKKGLFK